MAAKNTSKSSVNSSKPSSQSPKDESAISHAGTHTKGKVYDPSRSANTRTVETVEVSKVSSCEECGEDLREIRPHGHERAQPNQVETACIAQALHLRPYVSDCRSRPRGL